MKNFCLLLNQIAIQIKSLRFDRIFKAAHFNFYPKLILAFILALIDILIIESSSQAINQDKYINPTFIEINNRSSLSNNRLIALKFNFKLPNSGAPRGRRSAGTRDSSCPTMDVGNGVTALVPEPEPESAFGLTSSDRPTFWFYLPFAPKPQATEEVEFVLVDTETEEDIYQTTLTLQGTPGIIGIPLPADRSALAVGRQYRWTLSYICQPENRREDIAIDGVVERVVLDPTVSNQLQTAKSDRDRLSIYAANGLWYDALTTLARLYQSQPQDKNLKADWFDLLKSVGLENLTQKPIVAIEEP